MAKVLHEYSASVFFERFFDTVLRVNAWPNFSLKECHKIEVRLEELSRLIGVRFEWERQINILGMEARCLLEFINLSRYGKYHYLIILFRDRFGSDQALTERFIIQLSKLMIIFSIEFWRTVNELHWIVYDVQEKIFGSELTLSADEVIAFLNKITVSRKQKITQHLTEDQIAWNPKAKGLACRLSALLDEMESPNRTADKVREVIFDTPIDIEHIESFNHKDEAERERIQAEWGEELNRIGNLMVLESSLNRSISNEEYKTVKRPAYAEQNIFRIVKKQAEQFPEWSLAACKQRKTTEVNKLVNYLCS